MNLRRLPLLTTLSPLVLAAACATAFPDQNFLVHSLHQERSSGEIVTVLTGQMALDELPGDVRQQLIANGYQPGDLVQAMCRLTDTSDNARGDFLVLKKPDSTAESDWWHIGTSHPELFDNLEDWQNRKVGTASGEGGPPTAGQPHGEGDS